jgi:hypothetical protein
MAVISGRYGSVKFSSGELTIKSWSLNYIADLYDSTNFDDSTGGKSYVSGFTGWSGSYEGFYSSGNTVVPGNTGTITLKSSTATVGVWKGSVIITGMDVNTAVDGLVTQSYTFQGTGALGTSS